MLIQLKRTNRCKAKQHQSQKFRCEQFNPETMDIEAWYIKFLIGFEIANIKELGTKYKYS